ncbi:MAG: LuxR family transcriptional regulator [Mesorhizobium sp.]|uniref:LuxR family transcriptional regulator n=1 Tax=Mesorhizobium sp. TaxID=1871066 RepID=UPI001201B88E|nr:LuxR family transcriptional regulator [Mesorhizobium sp.]TIU72455.1 MAG: LuxR family transcriptional regulator [Mesorhizobium sp.]TIW14131.1 MAG: LuxR family transcriptional regulator [Mesorhizobium sp.]TIX73407.1 MAG: LuxR family transcriptional regulator [Mesorhizobium sp.]
MHDVFHRFVEQLTDSPDTVDLRNVLAETASSLDLPYFAYLFPSPTVGRATDLTSTYPHPWTSHYLRSGYEKIDPVIHRARSRRETFSWNAGTGELGLSKVQQEFMDEAMQFGIRRGFTIPIHDRRGLFASLTFASDETQPLFFRVIDRYERALQLIAIFFHVHARRKLVAGQIVADVALSRREIECLQWASRGKSAWDIGHILGISQRTAQFHLDNAKKKLGVRTITQAAVRLATSKNSDHT